jgi:transcriptional regulator with XRE-family HTH domain
MLADHSGITREHLSELENGHKEIGIRTLEKIASAFDLNVYQLLQEPDPPVRDRMEGGVVFARPVKSNPRISRPSIFV